MAPRRGGDGAAGAQVVLGGGRGAFEPPPLKRMLPWQQDGSGQCDILAGGTDETGAFKGIYISGVHLLALLRTFQLSKVFMPVDTQTPIAALGQSLSDGIPLVIVTRGCFGRDLDYGPGPNRNEAKKNVWEVVRQMRADMPQVLITCIDLPINCGTDVVQACLEAPLNEYRELMYHEGTWYTPTVYNSAKLAAWKADFRRNKFQEAKPSDVVNFARKKFGWLDENQFYKDMWTVGWKAVLEVKPAPTVVPRTDLNFVEREPETVKAIEMGAAVSNAHAALQKAVAQARNANSAKDVLSAAKAFLNRAKYTDRAGLDECVAACKEAADLSRKSGNTSDATEAMATAVGASIYSNQIEAAMQIAKELKASAADAKVEVKAARLMLDCHFALGDLDQALDAAKAAKDGVAQKGDPEALAEAFGLVVSTHIARGDGDAAVAVAAEAAKSADKFGQAKGNQLLAEAHAGKASASREDQVKMACWKDAVSALKAARAQFKDLGKKKEEAATLEALVSTFLQLHEAAEALAAAEELRAFGEDAGRFPDQGMAGHGAMGCQLVAAAHVAEFGKSRSFLGGGEEAMMAAAKQAVATFEQLGESSKRMAASQVLLQARRCALDKD